MPDPRPRDAGEAEPAEPAEPAGSAEPAEPAPGALSVRAQQDLLSRTALGVFQLNGQFLSVSEELARPAGLTAARWQVLGAVLREPLPVAGIARAMGITRQSVQRVADLLAAKGLAEYVPNPAHRRAKLLRPTEEGRAAIARITPGHAALATRLTAALGEAAFAETARALERLSAALATIAAEAQDPPAPGSP
ncbi:MarR family winged helix-turn-helix transcriptional regulator [Streptomyces sp. NBC_00091]|uniref:MarR family winged helix-turn-helix transcriptional regulator n=1 Tax=Streptomyces sp. NBC_00091 TaxID=2975648 RepID=UPI0022543A82|nr:MarR family transcriptional regulator [Streptomyces sp. NBC_00091]MCX5377484.1 MarR family transcriptional regulator [Streptomyces sp. NBC_00091]